MAIPLPGGSKFTSDKNLSRSRANQGTKFPIFGKAEGFVADFSPRVKTLSNDVGMTWNLRWSFFGIRQDQPWAFIWVLKPFGVPSMLDLISPCGRYRALCTVIRCPIDLKFDGEPIGVILRRFISSDLDTMVPGSSTTDRLDFASKHQNRVKRRRNNLKFDVRPFGSM